MKKLLTITLLALSLTGFYSLSAANDKEEKLGLPGDNLNLYAVMDLFQNSETLEGFERSLNDPDELINNLDLNDDDEVDYIFVNDYPEDNIHQIVMQVALGKDDLQDVGVFMVEKFKDGSVSIQLIGDEALYGPDYIIEPNYDETPNPGYTGNVRKVETVEEVTIVKTTYYEVASWPVIVYVTGPTYRPWRTSWYWGYYPPHWHPWRPHYWHYYYGYHYPSYRHYHAYYRPYNHYRCNVYRDSYYTHRRHQSPVVVVNVKNDRYKKSYNKPESRRDGEVYYAKRQSENKTMPGRRASTRSANQPKEQNKLTRPTSERGQTTRDLNTDRSSQRNEREAVKSTRPATTDRSRENQPDKAAPDRKSRENNRRDVAPRPAPTRESGHSQPQQREVKQAQPKPQERQNVIKREDNRSVPTAKPAESRKPAAEKRSSEKTNSAPRGKSVEKENNKKENENRR